MGLRKKTEASEAKKEFQGAKITWENKKEGSLLAMFNASFSGLTIYGCKLFEKKDGSNFVAMPQNKGSDGKWYNVVYVNEDIAAMLCDWACKAYESQDGIYEHASK